MALFKSFDLLLCDRLNFLRFQRDVEYSYDGTEAKEMKSFYEIAGKVLKHSEQKHSFFAAQFSSWFHLFALTRKRWWRVLLKWGFVSCSRGHFSTVVRWITISLSHD